MDLQNIANQTFALLLGAVGGGVISAVVIWYIWFKDRQENTARTLLSEALAIQGLMEAWLLDGENYQKTKLSLIRDNKTQLPFKKLEDNSLWLRKVEVRAVLDEEQWNKPSYQFFGFIEGRRSWIVRDMLTHGTPVVLKPQPTGDLEPHPALLSSKGMHELCGWIERVTSAHKGKMLSHYGYATLRPFLLAVATEDRIEGFGESRLTDEARHFLRWYRETWKWEKKY